MQAWYAGIIAAYNARRGVHWVEYDDGDEEWVDLRKERCEFLDPPMAASGSGAPGRPVKQEQSDGEAGLSLALLAAAAESADVPAAGSPPAKGGPPSIAPRPRGTQPALRPGVVQAAGRGAPLAPTVQASSSAPLAPRPAGPHWLRPPAAASWGPHAAAQPGETTALSRPGARPPLAPAETAASGAPVVNAPPAVAAGADPVSQDQKE